MTTTIDPLTHPDAAALLAAIDAGDDSALPALANLLRDRGLPELRLRIDAGDTRLAVARRIGDGDASAPCWRATVAAAAPHDLPLAGCWWLFGYYGPAAVIPTYASRSEALLELARQWAAGE